MTYTATSLFTNDELPLIPEYTKHWAGIFISAALATFSASTIVETPIPRLRDTSVSQSDGTVKPYQNGIDSQTRDALTDFALELCKISYSMPDDELDKLHEMLISESEPGLPYF
ncbi:hypothetical protein Pse7367_2339 [Thalassoporum mexicanum PCC 7367]|uniref:hypothetical protein n=1 Tax=Thalassoporum mexicanum TaxID=3457544 RepID=UPI00029FDD43|nr:hypothetical protein [Pseudanabaena sp. PCC 7367]AFY70600.1 hypothetical protein Pse7367_2339 [Pseudanabaena sp. PCC 7367]